MILLRSGDKRSGWISNLAHHAREGGHPRLEIEEESRGCSGSAFGRPKHHD